MKCKAASTSEHGAMFLNMHGLSAVSMLSLHSCIPAASCLFFSCLIIGSSVNLVWKC